MEELAAAVRAAEERCERAHRLVRESRGSSAAYDELSRAFAARADADRALARARGEEVAVPYPWSPRWSPGAPMPHVVASGHRTLLLYLAHERDPAWDGTHVAVVDPRALHTEPLVLVEVVGCYGHRFGGPNDEVFSGHPLARRGLEGYGAYEIERSRWLATEQATNSVHAQYDPATWTTLRHFLLAFHDDVFECLARGFRTEPVRGTFQQLLSRMVERVR